MMTNTPDVYCEINRVKLGYRSSGYRYGIYDV